MNQKNHGTVRKKNMQWQEMFELYVEFKQALGREPAVYEVYKNKKLGQWVRMQRDVAGFNELSEKTKTMRKEKLVATGFQFTPQARQR